MGDARRAAYRAAMRTGKTLAKLFARMGTSEHPRGRILVAYRNAHRALSDVMRRGGPMLHVEAREVLDGLVHQVQAVVTELANDAAEAGEVQATVELEARGVRPVRRETSVDYAVQAVVGLVETQAAMVLAALMSGADAGLVLGDATRTGVLTPVPVIREGTRWLADVARVAWGETVVASTRPGTFLKQAVAAIDERTTDCCLRVHAQIVPMEEQFRLTGTPRYADRLAWPPFHWFCRTSVVLVTPDEKDDELTRKMREAADAELEFRAQVAERIQEIKQRLARLGTQPDARMRAGDTVEITSLRLELKRLQDRLRGEVHPASATSRR